MKDADNERRTQRDAMRTTRKARGAGLLEVVFAFSIGSLVVFGGTLALVTTFTSWYRGQERITAEVEVQQALKHIRTNVREAMRLWVDADGRGITFQLPARDGEGNYISPVSWDGVVRRYHVGVDGVLRYSEDGVEQDLLRDVVLHINDNGTLRPYVPFIPGPGVSPRQVTVQIVTRRMIRAGGEAAWGRGRETILLRNVPPIS
ncbi:MAG: hypothetical protein QXI19_03840 [Candidatus Caldarchaeum sp.]